MGTWKTRGLRGSALEELINLSLDIYRENKLALIQKIPTPITPIEIDSRTKQIKLAYFNQKSTVDYIGNVQGIPVCFDAKECASDTFPLSNVHEHQMQFMKEFEEQNGIAFLILGFSKRNEYFYISYQELDFYWKRMLAGGKKSFTYEEIDKEMQIYGRKDIHLHFLECLARDIEKKEEREV